MRLLPCFLALCLAFTASGNPVFDKLVNLNRCWTEQDDIAQLKLPNRQPLDETGWIKLHLTLVEQRLRQRSTNHLSKSQQQNRAAALDHLHEYLLAGSFPQNEDYSYRTPIFIDKYDNFCAVGYLVKATGFEQVSRMIASKTNLAYVHQMNYPELNQWAEHFGFTRDELAWIQPGYLPLRSLDNMGYGTNGIINELYVDTATERMYVGGAFTQVDSSINTGSIAYVTEQNGIFTWHAMGAGLNGPVHAITKHGNKIFAAGSFSASGNTILSNVGFWDGSAWQAAGCIDGLVKDLVVFDGHLYAAGNFDACGSGPTDVNFAKWNGNAWIPIAGLSGTINTLEATDSVLLLGGNFSVGSYKNVAKWHPRTGFEGFYNELKNEPTDFEDVFGTMYISSKRIDSVDIHIMHHLSGDSILADDRYGYNGRFYSSTPSSVQTIFVDGSICLIGGDFNAPGGSPYTVSNNFDFVTVSGPYTYPHFDRFQTDSTINKIVRFKNHVIAAGKFKNIDLNGIGRSVPYIWPLSGQIVYENGRPCKFSDAASLRASGHSGFPPYKYNWSTGDTTQVIGNLYYGTYSVVTTDRKGSTDTVNFTVVPAITDTSILFNVEYFYYANRLGYVFQWVDCENNYGPVAPVGQHRFTPERSGSYAVIFRSDTSANACADTSGCHKFVPLAIAEVNGHTAIKAFPNPAGDFIYVDLGSIREHLQVVLTDLTGRTLITQNAEQTDRLKIDIAHLPPGMYTLKVSDGIAESRHIKIVKE